MLPKKRKPVRSGLKHYPERVFQRHRAFLRSHECVVTLTSHYAPCEGQIEVSHIRTAANSGTGMKPMDSSAVPMCQHHHQLYHRIGHESWERRFTIDLTKLAAEFAARTPDEKLREVLRDSRPLIGEGVE